MGSGRMNRKPKSKTTHLHWQPLADGTWAGHWKPSPRLRDGGWTNRKLGTSDQEADVLAAAIALNNQVEEWDRGHAAAAAERAAPRRYRFSDLVDEYRVSNAFLQEIEASTRREYDVRLRQLEQWAVGSDGRSIFVDQLDDAMVRELRDTLMADRANVFKCASLLRVLRLLLNWGKPRIVSVNATDNVPIPTPPSRSQKLAWSSVEHLADNAGDRLAARVLNVGFWSMQRRDDLRQINRFQWRELHGADPRDLPALLGPSGRVMGFRLQQHKTGRWVDCPMPPWLHDEIEAAFAESQWLFPGSKDAAKPVSGEVILRKVKPFLIEFDLRAIEPELLAREILPMFPADLLAEDPHADPAAAIHRLLCADLRYWTDADRLVPCRAPVLAALKRIGFVNHQLRDLRRSGMSGVKDLGAMKSDVFAISGHPLDGQKRTMADTYMPPDTMAACRAIAAACRTIAAMKAREEAQ